jgi:two-component system response regulator
MDSKRILLVDDNPSDVDLTIRAFERCSIVNEIVVAEDGQEALDYLWGRGKWDGRNPCEIPALTLLDLKLPKVSGLDVLRQIRAEPHTRRVPVVILTSSREEQDVAAGYDYGVNGYIRKPVDFAAFAVTVQQLSLYWLVLNEPPPPPAR